MRRALVRVDDLGEADAATEIVLTGLATAGVRLACGVVPLWLDPEVTSMLRRLEHRRPGHVEIHQHGYQHRNHGTAEHKYEFGRDRDRCVQAEEIMAGRHVLERAFPRLLHPTFSPPYGSSDATVREILMELGFKVLSGLEGDADATILPTVSPVVDPMSWDPPRQRPWPDVERQWAGESARLFSGIVLHPRFLDEPAARDLVARLPRMLNDWRSVVFRDGGSPLKT
jgi:peptidoglycan/xylan/chitin deacetylase (PgdA/CDA1 family)